MKKLLHIGLIAVLALGTVVLGTGCGSKDAALPYSEYNLDEYVTVGEYKGLEYKKPEIKVSDKEIKSEIQSRLESHQDTKEIKKGKVKDGDTINVSFEGKIDGKTFDGGTSDDYDITVGQTSMIDGFVEGLVGQKIGSTVTLDLKFPDPYTNNEELSGKPVTFEVNIKCKKVYVTPEYNMDFVKKNYSSYDSLEAFEEGVKSDITATKESEQDSEIRQNLWSEIMENSKVIKYPEEKDELINTTMQSFKDDAKEQGMEWADYLEKGGYDEEQLTENITSYAENQIMQEMVLYSIADKEKVEVSDKEYKEYMQNMLSSSGFDEETFKNYTGQTIEEYCEQQGLRTSMLLDKVLDKVVEYGVVE